MVEREIPVDEHRRCMCKAAASKLHRVGGAVCIDGAQARLQKESDLVLRYLKQLDCS